MRSPARLAPSAGAAVLVGVALLAGLAGCAASLAPPAPSEPAESAGPPDVDIADSAASRSGWSRSPTS